MGYDNLFMGYDNCLSLHFFRINNQSNNTV